MAQKASATDNFAEALEPRKEAELREYERLYKAGGFNSDPKVRNLFLRDSEEAFKRLIRERSQGKRVLEIGCGDGTHAVLSALSGARVTAIDLSPEGVRLAQQAAQRAGVADRVECLVMDAEDLEFADNSFDLIVEHEVFSSVDLRLLLPGIHRVLAPGGSLIGKESFGHNPVFNLNRRISLLRKRRTRWAVEHIVRARDLDNARALFQRIDVEYYHLSVIFAAMLGRFFSADTKAKLAAACSKLDRWILQKALFRRGAFKVVFEMSTPTGK